MILSDSIIEKIIILYNKRIKRKDIAEELGISLNQIKHIIDGRKSSLDKSKLKTIEQKIKRLYLNGYSKKQISEETGWRVDRIKTFLYRKRILKNKKLSTIEEEKIIELWRIGNSPGKIILKTRLPRHAVYYFMKEKSLI